MKEIEEEKKRKKREEDKKEEETLTSARNMPLSFIKY